MQFLSGNERTIQNITHHLTTFMKSKIFFFLSKVVIKIAPTKINKDDEDNRTAVKQSV